MSKKGSIVGDKLRLRRFKIMLNDECSLLGKEKSFSAIKDLEMIIDEVSVLHEELKSRLIDAKVIRSKPEINDNLTCFYGQFFDSFDEKSEIFKWLLNNSEDYFFARKIHQLSHAKGEYKENLIKQKKVAEESQSVPAPPFENGGMLG